jgi:ribosomal protein S18 acetylase RimI-like enzyme
MNFDDWRDTPAPDLVPLYEAENRRWLDVLDWDLAPSWQIVEEARAAGRVPGLVARHADGRLTGWAFYVLHDGFLQIGGIAGDTAAAVRGLLERILESPEAGLARGFSCFLFPASPSLQSALGRQRFLLRRHLYLSREFDPRVAPTASALPADLHLRPLSRADLPDIVRLLARSYAGRPEARCFAPDARLDQWAHYVGQLLGTPAVGRYLPAASFVIERRDGPHPVGVVVTTSLSRRAAHIAQVVVDPGCRQSGLGRILVDAACNAAGEAGHARTTLLVAECNEAARTLYERVGFKQVAHFLYASRPTLARRASTPASRQVSIATIQQG